MASSTTVFMFASSSGSGINERFPSPPSHTHTHSHIHTHTHTPTHTPTDTNTHTHPNPTALTLLPHWPSAVKADLGFNSRFLHWGFSVSSHTSDLKIRSPVVTLSGVTRSVLTGWPGVSILMTIPWLWAGAGEDSYIDHWSCPDHDHVACQRREEDDKKKAKGVSSHNAL